MINISEICKRFNQTSEKKKLPAHFMLLREMQDCRKQCQIEQGKNGYIKIPETKMTTFLIWLSPETRKAVLEDGQDWQTITNTI